MPLCYHRIRGWICFVIGIMLLSAFLIGCGAEDEKINIPPAPKGLEHTLVEDEDQVSLLWQEVEYAETYRIYRGPQVDGDFQTIGTSSTTTYDDIQIARGSIYIYKIAGVSGDGVEGETSAPYQVIIPAEEPRCDIRPTKIPFHRSDETHILTIQNTGSGLLEWKVQNLPEWLNMGKTTGQTGAEFPSQIQLTINQNKLQSDQTYAATLIFASNDADAPERTINVTFSPPPKMLIVRDLRSGIPIPDATLEIEGSGFSDTVKTDSSGSYALQAQSGGSYTVSASKAGYMPGVYEIDTSLKDEFELTMKPIPKATKVIRDNARPFATPAYIAFSTDGSHAYVTNQQGNNVSVIDTFTDRVLKTVNVGTKPIGLAVNPRIPQLYVVNSKDGTVSIINTNTNEVIGDPIAVGKTPIHAAVNDYGTSLYVANSGENSVSVLKLAALVRESYRVDVGRAPYGIARSVDDGVLFVTNTADDSISIVALLTRRVERVVAASNAPRDIASIYDEDALNSYVLVSNYLGGNLVVFDTDKGSVEVHELGRFPTGIAVVSEPDGSYTAYIAVGGEALVRIFDFATMQVIDESISVGGAPVGVAAHPDGDKIYVVNSGGNSVTVLEY